MPQAVESVHQDVRPTRLSLTHFMADLLSIATKETKERHLNDRFGEALEGVEECVASGWHRTLPLA